MFADEIRCAIQAAPRTTLPSVAALLWRAYGAGQVTEPEAETLSAPIETRTISAPPRRENVGLAHISVRLPMSENPI